MGETLTSTSTSSSAVSYLLIYKSWLKKDQNANFGNLTIPVETILPKLWSQVLTQADYEMVNHEVTREQKLLKLCDILSSKGELGFDQLVKILFENKCDGLANNLLKEKNNLSRTNCSNEPPGDEIPIKKICLRNQTSSLQNPQMKVAQAHLAILIKRNVDLMAKYWSDVIRVAKTEAAFVQVQVLEHFKSENGNPVNSYREVFDMGENEIHPRILIQADPGCGKTTYVNKLAIDWANKDEYLRDKFDFVFLITLQTLTMDVFDAITCSLPKQSQAFFSSHAESAESKILLILDGFDELVENSEWYSSVMDILNGQSMQFQFFHLIVTTRRSHVEKIPKRFREKSLLIKGFDQQSMKQFLDKQHVPLPSVGQESNLSHLLQTPLFCAIYCSLRFGEDPIELEDSYDLIKALVENSVTVKKKTVANVEEQLDEIGKFAFQMLDSKSLEFVKKFCRSSEVIKPSLDLARVNLDLLIKRTIPLGGVNRFKEQFSLPHQLIAEYLAARYFARSLTEEQLKQADTSELIPDSNYRVLNLPFVRFFLFELLFLYLEQKYDESVFDNFLNIPQLRFIWNIKSNKDIPTIDNVSELNLLRWDNELVHHSRFFPTLSKYRHPSSLNLSSCSKNHVKQLVNFINNKCFQNLIKLAFGMNENVGSTPQLFTALSNCKHLQVLDLTKCKLTVESTTELARCIDNNGLSNLRELPLFWNGNVGSTPQLFTALSNCKHLQVLDLTECKLTVESTTELARCIDNNGLSNLRVLRLGWNENFGSTPQLFIALSKCKHLQVLHLCGCKLTVESTTELARCIDNNGLADLTELQLGWNGNVGSTPQLFTALSNCKHLQVLDLTECKLTVESTTELARCFDNNGLADLTELRLGWNGNVGSTPQLFTALSNCKHLQVLDLTECKLTVESTTELARCIDNNGLSNLRELRLFWNENVGSTPQLFTALSKCKHLQVLDLTECKLTVESTTELALCINNNELADLTELDLQLNKNVGSSTELFHVLHKCPQLQTLYLSACSMTQESLNIFLSMLNSNTFQQLDDIQLRWNEDIKVDDNFFIALEKCPKISRVRLSSYMESDLSEVGRKAKETLEQRGCRFRFEVC